MEKKLKAMIYARQSSGDEKESASVNQQIENCQKLAASRGLIVTGCYFDLNTSGKFYPDTEEARSFAEKDIGLQFWLKSTSLRQMTFRSGFGQVFAQLKNVDYVIVDDFTRLMRPLPNSYLEVYVNQALTSEKVTLICVKDGDKNPESMTDRLLMSMISQFNAIQLENQRKKSRDALKKLRDTGLRPSCIKFRGYAHGEKKHQYQIVEEEAKLVRRAFELGNAHLPYAEISRRLRKEFGWKDAGYDALTAIFKRPEYAGYQYNSQGDLIESRCFKDIAIISLAQFQGMQSRLALKKHVRNHDRKNVYAFTGLCFCGYCGHRMLITSPVIVCLIPTNRGIGSSLFPVPAAARMDVSRSVGEHEYYNNAPWSPNAPLKRIPVTNLNATLIPNKLYHLGLHESLMPLITIPLLEAEKRLIAPLTIFEKIQRLELLVDKQVAYEQKLGKMLFDEKIDDAQFETMAANSKASKEDLTRQIHQLKGDASINRTDEKKRLDALIYCLQLKHIDRYQYKKYAQEAIRQITLFSHSVSIDFHNGKNLQIERIPIRGARVFPNWSLSVKGNKAFITYYYKSFFNGDRTERLIYEDTLMRITTIGRNPGYREWSTCPNHDWLEKLKLENSTVAKS